MIQIFCRLKHADQQEGVDPREKLCRECRELLEYACARLARCPFAPNKPTCARCPIHCYKPAMREKIRVVMRFAGPRMLCRHPILALLHQWDEWRSPRLKPRIKRKNEAGTMQGCSTSPGQNPGRFMSTDHLQKFGESSGDNATAAMPTGSAAGSDS